jgi:hypothetical protein
MPSIQRLLQEFGAGLPSAGERHSQRMQLMVGGGGADLELVENVAQLRGREAGPDDRAVQTRVELRLYALDAPQ